MPDLGTVIKTALFDFFKAILEPIINALKGIVESGVEIILYTPVPKRCVEGSTQSYPDCPTTVALVQKPANAPWPSIHETAWTKVLPTAVTVLFVLYLFVLVVQALPPISRKQTQTVKTNIFSALIGLLFSWPVTVGILAFFAGLSKVLAPNPGAAASIITAQLGVLLTLAAVPGANILSVGISSVNGAVIAGAILAYLFRILFLLFVPQYIHLFAVFYLLDVPILKGVVTKLFEVFVAMAFLPLLVAGLFDFAATLFSADGKFTLIGGLTDFTTAIIAMVLPIASLGLYYLALKGAMMSGMSQALSKAESKASGRVGDLGEASSDEYGGLVEEQAARMESRVEQGAHTAAAKTGRRSLNAAKKARYAAHNPTETRRKTRDAVRNTPSTLREKASSGMDTALAAYENAPSSASEAMKQAGLKSRDLEDVDRREVGAFGHAGSDSQNYAGTLTDKDPESESESGTLSASRVLGTVERADGSSMNSLLEDTAFGGQTAEGGIEAGDAMSEEDVDDLFESPPDADAGQPASAGSQTPVDRETFDRAVAESDISRDGMRILLQNIEDENGEKAAERVAQNASYLQLARESGRQQARETTSSAVAQTGD